MSESFYWHDYETFGTDPSRDRPVQFAGIRTDSELNIIDEPLKLYARPARDVLPHPAACLVTGISPQLALEQGLPEAEFISRIHAELCRPGTCNVGYNSIRFDDEVTRYTLYRNFFDPYEHTYRNDNSRWDIIDMVRLAHALRPQGIEWPREDGHTSFRLELLTQANGLGHEPAHDALADVEATIALARLLRERQPRLFDYALRMRSKQAVLEQLDLVNMKPVLHVSGMFGVARHNIALVVPVARHPEHSNEIICFDLSTDPARIADLDVEALRERLFASREALAEGEQRPGLKTIHINRCPLLVTPKLLDPPTAERLQIDVDSCRKHRAGLRSIPDLAGKLQAVYANRQYAGITDPDRMLYSGGFFSDRDKRSLEQVRSTAPEALAEQSFVFEDARLPEMLFRYRARNYPQTLTAPEQAQWEEHRFQYLTDPDAGASITLEVYQQEIAGLLENPDINAADRHLLEALLEYGDSLLA